MFLGNHTVAIIKGSESYEILQTSCARIFKDVNKIVKDRLIEVDGENIPVEMYLGGDYKVHLKQKYFPDYTLSG